ncbi:hypothetical protein BYT27DRAFT_7252140 [Phlegmacium glaucopus]|nr:hypothetical protein BYT27DRAFT_7252140 [Phlegmacium glaucopus]
MWLRKQALRKEKVRKKRRSCRGESSDDESEWERRIGRNRRSRRDDLSDDDLEWERMRERHKLMEEELFRKEEVYANKKEKDEDNKPCAKVEPTANVVPSPPALDEFTSTLLPSNTVVKEAVTNVLDTQMAVNKELADETTQTLNGLTVIDQDSAAMLNMQFVPPEFTNGPKLTMNTDTLSVR